jgi:hypothetical protein
MPKKIGVIILTVLVLGVVVKSHRVNIERIFNQNRQNRQEKETAKKISTTKIEYDPMPEAHDFAEMENKDDKPAAEKASQKSQIQDDVMGYRLKSKNRMRQVQAALKKTGFYKGDIDGKSGPQTKKAIEAFQK